MEKVSEDIQRLLKSVAEHFDKEDRDVRERQIRQWKKLKLYWDGFHNIWYSEVAHDWRIWDDGSRVDENNQAAYDKPVNVYRAYLESIIAALSVTVPAIKCVPDDANNILDLSTARGGDKIAELVQKHNDGLLLWIHALYIYCTEGMVAAYNYSHESAAYGTYDEETVEDSTTMERHCPNCDMVMTADMFNRDEYDPDEGPTCPECNQQINPDDPAALPKETIVSRVVGVTAKPKTRQCIEAYGGLYVKIPNYARKQADIPYLRFSYETHYANAVERYPDLRDKITAQNHSPSGTNDPYESWGRVSTQYNGEYPINNVTVNSYWFRPSAFNVLPEEEAAALRKKYPDGCKYVKINEHFAEARDESLDDHWTIASNPLSDYLHYDPAGLLLTSIQDITNDLFSLVIQTIEHGIPQTFADPGVLDFEAYRNEETTPGSIFPASPRGGKTLGEAFYEVKTATLSSEILPFTQNVQQMGQLVSGALPSLFGGSGGGSNTASEYSMSRAQALQRLQTPWKMLTLWWKNIFGKVIPAYIKNVIEDERFVEQDESGNFVNVLIRKAEIEGKIGSIELEANEQLPVTWQQKKDLIMQLLQLNNPAILEMLGSPENIGILRNAIGLDDFVIPGEADRNKEFEEIQQLLATEPTTIPAPIDPMTGAPQVDPMTGMPAQPQQMPSIPIDETLDNHEIAAAIDRSWLIGDAGRLAKIENPPGYMNVLLHYQAHNMVLQQQQMQQQMMEQQQAEQSTPSKGATNGERPDNPVKKAPIESDKDAKRFVP